MKIRMDCCEDIFQKAQISETSLKKHLRLSSKSSIIDLANASVTGRLMKSFRKLGVVHLECESTSFSDPKSFSIVMIIYHASLAC